MTFAIDTSTPYGNACDVSITEERGLTRVSFAADPHGGPECLWFCFRLLRTTPEVLPAPTLELILKHSYNMLGGHAPLNMRPVVRYENGDWQRLSTPIVEELTDGCWNVRWNIAAPASFVEVAYCYPYGPPEIETLLAETAGYWKADTIGVSQQGRPLRRLSNSYGQLESQRPGLYIVARQHSGETPGSWVLDGLLRHLAPLDEDAPLVWAVPLANIDGIEQGDYGKDNFPYDIYRAWGKPPMRHEVLALQWDVNRWSYHCRPMLAIDLHAPGACEADGIYCHVPAPEEYPERHQAVLQWTAPIIEALTPQYAAPNFHRVARYASRWETPTTADFFVEQYDIATLTMEVPYALTGELVLTREHYQQAGARLAAAIVARLRSLES